MAIDEAIFLQCRSGASQPAIRFYSWETPAVSVGHFQQIHRDIDLAACRRLSLDVVRRPTGGKAVLHEHDWTYAMVGLDRQHGIPSDILGAYRLIGRCLIRGLRELGIEAAMAEGGRSLPAMPAPASCFSVPSRYELLVKGRKICGSAQVRSRGGFLQQGSLLLDFDPLKAAAVLLPDSGGREKQAEHLRQSVTSLRQEGASALDMEALCTSMKAGFEAELGIHLQESALTPEEEALRGCLMRQKYRTDAWNLKGREGHEYQ